MGKFLKPPMDAKTRAQRALDDAIDLVTNDKKPNVRPHLSDITAELVRGFGGSRGLALRIVNQYHKANSSPSRQTAILLKVVEMIVRDMVISGDSGATDTGDMTHDDMKAEVGEIISGSSKPDFGDPDDPSAVEAAINSHEMEDPEMAEIAAQLRQMNDDEEREIISDAQTTKSEKIRGMIQMLDKAAAKNG